MLKIVYTDIDKLNPYAGNAKKHPGDQIEKICQSIEQFGFNDPVATWHGEIVEGHGRVMAAKRLGMDKVPVIKLDELTDEQRKAYTLVHNKLTMDSGFDEELLAAELENLPELDMEQFGFELPELDDIGIEISKPGWFGDEKERNLRSTNTDLYDPDSAAGRWGIPELKPVDYIPKKLIGFNYCKTAKEYDACVHFYLDDYQFERLWNAPYDYMPMLTKFEACMTPNFSIYLDMPEAVKIWNTYRARLLGEIMQRHEITVVPIVYWSTEQSWEYCFDGIPKDGTVSVNYIANSTEKAKELWNAGMDELIRRKHPRRILLYGNGAEPQYDFGHIEVLRFKNTVTERMRESRKSNA